MKRFFISLLAIISVATLSAQNRGEVFAGGSIGIGTTSFISSGKSMTDTNFNIAPEFGYFAINNLKIGASISYGLVSGESRHTIQIMPNIAYHLLICDKFYYTPGIALGFMCNLSKDVSMPGFGLGLSLGSFEFRPTPKLGFSINLLAFEYSIMTSRYEDVKLKISGVNFRLGSTPSIGVRYYF